LIVPLRKVPKTKNNRGPLRFMRNDIVRAIDGVTAAGLQVYAVEITPTGAMKINTKPPPHQAVPDKKISTKADDTRPDDTTPVKKTSLAVLMNSDIRGVLVAWIIVILTFAIGVAGHFLR
jgi:hypothetical protein